MYNLVGCHHFNCSKTFIWAYLDESKRASFRITSSTSPMGGHAGFEAKILTRRNQMLLELLHRLIADGAEDNSCHQHSTAQHGTASAAHI